MILYRHADPRFPFLWETHGQPGGRWHADGQGPVQYLADTPDGAWAEFIRHEGITDEAEIENVRRALWAVDVPDDLGFANPRLPLPTLTGGLETYDACRTEAHRLQSNGAKALRAPSAALMPGEAHGWRVDSGTRPAEARDGWVFALYGPSPLLVGWCATVAGRPDATLVRSVRPL